MPHPVPGRAVGAGLIYWIKRHAVKRPRQPAFVALCVTAVIATVASLLSIVPWIHAMGIGITGGGYHGHADFLLP